MSWQIRYGQLLKQQETLIRAMEACVSHREMITTWAEAQSKLDKKHSTKNDSQSKKEELKKKIKEIQEVSKDSGAAGAHTAGVGLVGSSRDTENPPKKTNSGRMVRNAAELEN